jgi:predicted nuclease with TOPRIM domain
MDIGAAILILAGLATIATVLGFTFDGPRLYSRLKARIQAPRREREELQKRLDELWKKVDDQATQIGELMRLTAMQGGSLTQYAEWVRDLQTEVGLLGTDPAPLKLEKRVEALEDVVSRIQIAAAAGLPLHAWEEVDRVFGPPQEPAKEPERLQAPDYRHDSN